MLESDYENKLIDIREVSDPEKVQQNLIKYCDKHNLTIPDIYVSSNKRNKYMLVNPLTKKVVHFGSYIYQDFTKHKNTSRRRNYLLRANGIKGNWKNNPFSPNNLSINLLWQA